jgi:Protein of unknown function (DUF1353)
MFRWRSLVYIILCASLAIGASAAASGRYVGELVLKMADDGRTAILVQPFGYVDPEGREWPVPVKTVVDGASIPRPLWSIVGSPWTGLYRKASVIHDYYCDIKDRGWRNVHKVFYDAMLTEGLGIIQAKIMYAAVLQFGPKWKKEFGVDGRPHLLTYQPPFDQKRLDQTINWIKSDNPDISEIEALVN